MQGTYIDIFKGIGMFFIHPLLYYLIGFSLLIGYVRVRKERSQFNIAINNSFTELRYLLTSGLLVGLLVSTIIIIVGIIVPLEVLILFAFFTVLLSFTTRLRLVSPTYVIGLTFFTLMLITLENNFVPDFAQQYTNFITVGIFPALAILLAIFIFAEALIVMRDQGKNSSPRLIKGKRGFNIGLHKINRLSLLPVIFIVPGSLFKIPDSLAWWPVFSIGEETFAILLIPFAIGVSQVNKGSLPSVTNQLLVKWLFGICIITLGLAVASYFDPHFSIGAVAFAIIAREVAQLCFSIKDAKSSPYFSKRNEGLTILGIIPNSPADNMELKIGESIVNVNGVNVTDEFSFYEAIQINSAHCKITVLDEAEEMRYVQRALYEGDHHKLGIIFVK